MGPRERVFQGRCDLGGVRGDHRGCGSICQKARGPFRGRAQGLRNRRFAQRHQFVEVRDRLRLEGHLTSDYTVASSNDDSGIAERVAGLIAKGIKTWTPTDRIVSAAFCPYCGAKATGGAAFCSSCGAMLPHVPKRP